MPKTKDGGFIIDDEVIEADTIEEWGRKMREKAGIKPDKNDPMDYPQPEDEEEEQE